jgi:uracil-DNA glycosylase family 4
MERPGQEENRYGRVACGKTGQELDELYLPLAGLDRSEVRLINTVLCGHESNKAPTDKEIAQCAPHHIPDEIDRTNPDVIVLMGASACSLVPGIKLDLHHGVPQHTYKVGDLFGWHGWLVPMYHPAMGLHESRWMKQIMDDWTGLKDFINADDTCRAGDPEPELTRYSEWTPRHSWVSGEWPIGVDTESHAGLPWSVQVSGMPRHGVLYRTDNNAAMDHLRSMMRCQGNIVMHHAAHDMEVLRSVGVEVHDYRDTLQEAFQLGDLPQGLKPLAYRLFRHTMTSWEETVRPASVRALTTWMTEALCVAQLDFTSVTPRFHKKTGKRLTDEVKRGEMEALLARLLQKSDPDSAYDPWGGPEEPRLDAFWHDPLNEWMTEHVEARIGPYPKLGIANCSMDEAVRYAVGDADWTGRVAVELARRRAEAFKIYEGDRDV